MNAIPESRRFESTVSTLDGDSTITNYLKIAQQDKRVGAHIVPAVSNTGTPYFIVVPRTLGQTVRLADGDEKTLNVLTLLTTKASFESVYSREELHFCANVVAGPGDASESRVFLTDHDTLRLLQMGSRVGVRFVYHRSADADAGEVPDGVVAVCMYLLRETPSSSNPKPGLETDKERVKALAVLIDAYAQYMISERILFHETRPDRQMNKALRRFHTETEELGVLLGRCGVNVQPLGLDPTKTVNVSSAGKLFAARDAIFAETSKILATLKSLDAASSLADYAGTVHRDTYKDGQSLVDLVTQAAEAVAKAMSATEEVEED